MSQHLPSCHDVQILESLRAHRRAHRQHYPSVPTEHLSPTKPPLTYGQQVADLVARTVGSWKFILIQSAAICVWIVSNSIWGQQAWDPYPFILLNLLLSFQAAYTAPAIMMSQNRQSEVDRLQASNDFEINVKAELEIELLHQKIDLLKEQELMFLTEAIKDLSSKIEKMQKAS